MGIQAGNCAVCKEKISDGIVSCSKCEAPHHRDCWDYGRSCCSIYGCGSKTAVFPKGPPEYVDKVALMDVILNLWIFFIALFIVVFFISLKTKVSNVNEYYPPVQEFKTPEQSREEVIARAKSKLSLEEREALGLD